MTDSVRCIYSTLIFLLLMLSACGGGSQQATVTGDAGIAQSDLPRDASPAVSDQELKELVSGNTAFALDIYQRLAAGQDGNIFYSPYSISQALAMTYAGAATDTERQMATPLGFTLPQGRLHAAFNALDIALASRADNPSARNGKGFSLKVVNAIWGQQGFPFLKTYLDVLARNYGAGMRLLDFAAAPEESRTIINGWVDRQTQGKIKDLLPPRSIGTDTRMVLTNAIYFKAGWAYPFDVRLTSDAPFHLMGGGTIQTPMMAQTYFFNYAESESFQAVQLPYDGFDLSMVILLPRPGRFAEFEQSLTAGRLDSILGSMAGRNVTVKLPRLSFTSDTMSLRDSLKALGMTDAFMPDRADFSGIDARRDLFISDVIHKSFLAVDEYGTEAAAATAVIMGITGAPPPPAEFTADRPFILLIRDYKTGAVLFLGRVVR